MAGPYVLSESALAALSALLERENARASNDGSGDPSRTGDGEQPAPETYVVRTPTDGIPAMVGDVPGSADCDVHQLTGESSDSLLATPATRLVYNLAADDVPGDSWAIATRDKFGKWWIVEVTGDDRYCHNNLAALQTRDCLTATLTESTGGGDEVTMVWNGVNPWVSLADITYFGVAGKLVFFLDDGRLRLWLTLPPTGSGSYGAYADLIDCGDGCWMGGPLTGHEPASGQPACEGRTFTICLACMPCGGVPSGCCNPTPFWLKAVVTSADCPDLEGVYPMRYYAPGSVNPYGGTTGSFFGVGYWYSTVLTCPSDADKQYIFEFFCVGTSYQLNFAWTSVSGPGGAWAPGNIAGTLGSETLPHACSPFQSNVHMATLSGGTFLDCWCTVATANSFDVVVTEL